MADSTTQSSWPTPNKEWWKNYPTYAKSSGGTIGGKPATAFEQLTYRTVPSENTGLTGYEQAFLDVADQKRREDAYRAALGQISSSNGSGGGVNPAYQALADILLQRAQSGSYANQMNELAGRLSKQTRQGRKQIKGGFSDLLSGLRQQTNPYADMAATPVDVSSNLSALLGQQGVGNTLLQEQLGLLGANEASRQAAYNDLANMMSTSWKQDRQAAVDEAKMQRQSALSALNNQRGLYGMQLESNRQNALDNLLQQLLDLVGKGVKLPDNWLAAFGGK